MNWSDSYGRSLFSYWCELNSELLNYFVIITCIYWIGFAYFFMTNQVAKANSSMDLNYIALKLVTKLETRVKVIDDVI